VSAPAVEEVKGKVESRASGKPKAPAPTTAKEGTKETAKGKEEGAKVTEKTKAAVAPKGVEEEARAAEKAKAVSAPAAEEVKGKEEGRAAEKAKAPTASVAEEEKAKEKAKAKAEEGPKVAEKTKGSTGVILPLSLNSLLNFLCRRQFYFSCNLTDHNIHVLLIKSVLSLFSFLSCSLDSLPDKMSSGCVARAVCRIVNW